VSVNASALHRDAIVVDTHIDTILQVVAGKRRFEERSAEGHVDLPRLREGGVDVQVFAMYIEPQYKPDRALARALHLIDAYYELIARSEGALCHCNTVAEIEAAVARGQIAAILSIEGGEPVQTDLALARALHRLGVRALGLVWNERNFIADGVGELRTQSGLTNFGVALVQEMNRIGLLVDVSHLNERGFWDVAEVATRPFVASHSNARQVCDHPRNLWDDQIRALARAGGVMGMNFAAGFVDRDPERATLERVIDHVDHICGLVGPDHVGLGTDYDGIGRTPTGLEDVTRLPNFTEALLRRNYREADVRKILGGNYLRVFRAVWGA
jgi:membrane dipeptidase